MSETASIAPCRGLLYDIVHVHDSQPTKSEESARLLIEADDLLDTPKRSAVADETARKAVLRKIWLRNRRAGSPDGRGRGRDHHPRAARVPGPERRLGEPAPSRQVVTEDLWLRLCALFDDEYEQEITHAEHGYLRQPELF
jgi:hypothetical protein